MQPQAPRERPTRTIVAGVIGNVLEWYDFALFGFLAPVIAPLFFPSENHLASLLDTFGVFALGFLMRPIGGILFGHIGDRIGRKQALQWSVILMAIPTTAIAFLPTYEQIGLAAPLLLTFIRMLQGISVGGEFIGSMSFLGEHAPPQRRGYFGSWCTFSSGLGNLLGCGVAALVASLIPDEFLRAWGWRLPFLAGLGVGLVGLWLRHGVAESPTFEQATRGGETVRVPLFDVIRHERQALLTTVGLTLMLSVGFYLPWVWLATWQSGINTPRLPLRTALLVDTIAMAVMIALTPLGGALSDRLGRRRVIGAGCAILTLAAYPLFLVFSLGNAVADLAGQLLIALCAALISGPAPAAFVELFPTRTRYSGIALAYNGTQALLGGTTPLVATWLIHQTGYANAPAFYLLGAALLCGLATWAMTDRTGLPLR